MSAAREQFVKRKWRAPPNSCSTASGARCRPVYTISIPNARARRAVACPIAPRPITPSVLPASPVPSMKNMCQDHGVAERSSRSPSPSRRVTDSISPIARSAVASVRTPGVFVTSTPRSLQAATSMLS